MKLVKETINESSNDYMAQREKYNEIVSRKPYMKTILEDILKTTPEYRLSQIREDENRIVFWFANSGSMALYFGYAEHLKLMTKYDVYIQVPGNQTYSFSVSINNEPTEISHEEEPSKPLKQIRKIGKTL